MSIKLVAIDLDGTLVDDQKNVSQENKEAIQAAKDLGVKVVLCTGRPLKGMVHLLEETNLLEEGDYGITYNGGLVQKTHNGQTVKERTFNYEQVKEIFELSKEIQMPLNLIDLEKVYEPTYPKGRPSDYHKIMNYLPFEAIDMSQFSKKRVIHKMVMCYNQEELDQAIEKIPSEYFERFSIIKSRPVLLEFMPKGVDKGMGLKMLGDLLDIEASEMMAIGDMDNDLAMLEYAGVGVAMENAKDHVKKVSQFVTKTNNNHGVAHAIEKYILNH